MGNKLREKITIMTHFDIKKEFRPVVWQNETPFINWFSRVFLFACLGFALSLAFGCDFFVICFSVLRLSFGLWLCWLLYGF